VCVCACSILGCTCALRGHVQVTAWQLSGLQHNMQFLHSRRCMILAVCSLWFWACTLAFSCWPLSDPRSSTGFGRSGAWGLGHVHLLFMRYCSQSWCGWLRLREGVWMGVQLQCWACCSGGRRVQLICSDPARHGARCWAHKHVPAYTACMYARFPGVSTAGRA
jgi:hypothetical protein